MRETGQYSQLGQGVEKSTPMAEAFGELASHQGRTDDMVALLQKRLDAALSPRPPEADDEDAKRPYPSYTCELHELAMVSIVRQVRINERLQDLIDRVAI